MSQQETWEKLRETINRLIASADSHNVAAVCVDLFQVNVMRGSGLVARAVIQNVISRPQKAPVYAAIISVLNSKVSQIGEITLARTAALVKKAYMQDDRALFHSTLQFMCALVLQRVVEDIVVLQILQVLLEQPTQTSIEAAIEILESVGHFLDENSKTAANMVFDRLRTLLQEGGLLVRSQKAISEILRLRRSGLRLHLIDVVEDEDKETHFVDLTELQDTQNELNFFQEDPNYDVAEAEYAQFREEIEPEKEEIIPEPQQEKVTDMTDAVLLQHQKNIYLTVMSSMSADEAVHKLMRLKRKLKLDAPVLIDMIIKCCAQEKTYSKYFGVIGEKICGMGRQWHHTFTQQFQEKYETIYQYEGAQLRNMGKFFGHLLAADILAPQDTLGAVTLTEDKTNSASRVFVKFMFQEMVEELGIAEVKKLIQDPLIRLGIRGMFPVTDVNSDDADHIMFAINYFTAIGLGVLTEEMREVLKNLPEARGRRRSHDSRSGSDSYSRSRSYSRSQSYSRSRSNSGSRSQSYSRSPLRGAESQKA